MTFCVRAMRVAACATLVLALHPPHAASQENDFDDDGKGDIAVYRPETGTWYIRYSATSRGASARWGTRGDVPVPGDYDGDGRTDIAVYRPSNGVWYIVRSSTRAAFTVQWGTRGDVPVAADYDGDGRWDPAVFRPSNGGWYQLRSTTGRGVFVQWGIAGDVPVPADYDGDRKADPTVYRMTASGQGAWYQRRSRNGAAHVFPWGTSGDQPLAADFDADGRADPTLFRPSNGVWYQWRSASNRGHAVRWGAAGDVAMAGDFDGDRRADPTVYRPSTGTWWFLPTRAASGSRFQWGVRTDVPLPDRRRPAGTYAGGPPHVVFGSGSGTGGSSGGSSSGGGTSSTTTGRLRVMTWNIHFGKTPGGALNLAAQARVMANANADVILLQEVSTWDGDQPDTLPSLLRSLTGQNWSRVWSSHSGSGTGEGTLILTRLPVVSSSISNYYNRGFTRVGVRVNGVIVDIFNGHLEYFDTTRRTNQLRSWMAWMEQFSGPEIAGGDFNAWWGQSWITTMETRYSDTWRDVTGSPQNGHTLNNVRFDYLFRADDSNWRLAPVSCSVISTSTSDHRPVIAEYRVR
jgi:endonuclease/exonuclease/phosphatase family metal-dependent hydrolase